MSWLSHVFRVLSLVILICIIFHLLILISFFTQLSRIISTTGTVCIKDDNKRWTSGNIQTHVFFGVSGKFMGSDRGQAKVKARWVTVFFFFYLIPFRGYSISTPRWLVDVTPCTRRPQRIIWKKIATDRRRRRFLLIFLYFLGSTTIQWVREFPWIQLKWLNPLVKVFKIC